MSMSERRPLAEAGRLALGVVELLRPACTRIALAGSIRRREESFRREYCSFYSVADARAAFYCDDTRAAVLRDALAALEGGRDGTR